jgi:cell division protein FtsA
VAVLDIGASVSCIAIYEKGAIRYAEVIPLGGNSITNDLKLRFGLVYKQAERLKKEYGVATFEGISENEYI